VTSTKKHAPVCLDLFRFVGCFSLASLWVFEGQVRDDAYQDFYVGTRLGSQDRQVEDCSCVELTFTSRVAGR